MWLMTELGEFFSAVTDNQDDRIMWVRSRDEMSAKALAEYADAEVVHMLDADYEWRVIIPRTVWVDFLVDRAESARGTNFKSAVARNLGGSKPGWVGVCHDIWQTLYDYQHGWDKKRNKKSWSDDREWFDEHEDLGWSSYHTWELQQANKKNKKNKKKCGKR